jgi:hypothetical protein
MWKDVTKNMDREKALALVYGTLSAFMTAVHAVLVKSAVKSLEGSVLRLTYWSNMMSGMFLVRRILPLSLLEEDDAHRCCNSFSH